MRSLLIRYLLRFDGLAALGAGLFSISICTWLARVYGLPTSFVIFNAIVNLLYGTFSSTLATLQRRPISLIITLSLANCFWAIGCFAFVFTMPDTATAFAVGQAIFEGVFVGSLGILEWLFRRQLVRQA